MNILLFTDISFWIFFAFVLLGLSLFYNRLPLRNGFLFLCSIIFYFLIGGWFVLLVLLFSIIVNYLCGLFRHWFPTALAITINAALYVLLLTQVFPFPFPQTAFGSTLPVLSILPLGVSFYTFSAISYIVDVYKRRINPVRNFIDFGFYLSFFPTAAAGPILRATDFIPQLRKYYQLTSREFSAALFLILAGLVKITVADFIAQHFHLEKWLSMYGFAIQIYCVFSGYTDVATGVAMLLGFKIALNFDCPYKSTSLVDFCNRWYISFFAWLRDYVYIPLGGRTRGRTGAGIGVGVGVGGNAGVRAGGARARKRSRFWLRLAGVLITFHIVCFVWIVLRADTLDKVVLTVHQLFTPAATSWTAAFAVLKSNAAALSLIVIMFILHFLPEKLQNSGKEMFYNLPLAIKFLAAVAVFVVLYFF